MLIVSCFQFRSDEKFVTGNRDGSVSLFNKANLIKTKQLDGFRTLVEYCNGQIIAAPEFGKVTILNENLEFIEELFVIYEQVRSVSGNDTYLAIADFDGLVTYCRRTDDHIIPNVSQGHLLFSLKETLFRHTNIVIEWRPSLSKKVC